MKDVVGELLAIGAVGMEEGVIDIAGGVRFEPRFEGGGFRSFSLAVEGGEDGEGTDEDGKVSDRYTEGYEVDHGEGN